MDVETEGRWVVPAVLGYRWRATFNTSMFLYMIVMEVRVLVHDKVSVFPFVSTLGVSVWWGLYLLQYTHGLYFMKSKRMNLSNWPMCCVRRAVRCVPCVACAGPSVVYSRHQQQHIIFSVLSFPCLSFILRMPCFSNQWYENKGS